MHGFATLLEDAFCGSSSTMRSRDSLAGGPFCAAIDRAQASQTRRESAKWIQDCRGMARIFRAGAETEGGTSTVLQAGLAATHARAERQIRFTCAGLFGSDDVSEFGILGGHRSSIESRSNVRAGCRRLWQAFCGESHRSGILQVLQGLRISVDFL